MLWTSTALFCALASDAARQQLSVGQTTSAASVIERVGTLLQSHSSASTSKVVESLRSLATVTPGAIESMNQQLLDVIAQIESDVETKIIGGFQETQAGVTERISDLTSATTTAVAEKSAADAADDAWFTCVSIERSKREAIEAAELALQAAENSTVVPCQNQIDRSPFAYDPTVGADWEFTCDNEAGTCDNNLREYASMINDSLSRLETTLSAATAGWQDAKSACEAATADVAAKQNALATANSEWTSQRNTCLIDHENRQVAMCLFGTSLQTKCEKAAVYTQFVADIDQVNGGEYSEPDRQEEWRTVSVTKCMLAAIAAGGEIDSNALTTCESQVNYQSDVGVLDKQTGAFAEQTTPARFTCAETTITFRGETWTVPAGEAPPSSSYTTQEFTPAVDLAVGNSPFDFCNTGAPGETDLANPDYESRPASQGLGDCAIYRDTLPGAALHGDSHTVVMALEFGPGFDAATARQWIFNLGSEQRGDDHWLTQNGAIQFGTWSGGQVRIGEWSGGYLERGFLSGVQHTLATTYDSATKTYSLFVDGVLASSKQIDDLDIQSGGMLIGEQSLRLRNDIDFQGCVKGVDVYRASLQAEDVAVAASRLLASLSEA